MHVQTLKRKLKDLDLSRFSNEEALHRLINKEIHGAEHFPGYRNLWLPCPTLATPSSFSPKFSCQGCEQDRWSSGKDISTLDLEKVFILGIKLRLAHRR